MAISWAAPADHVFERVRDHAGSDRTGRNSIERCRFRARIFENFSVKIKRADDADGILVAERLNVIEDIGDGVVADVADPPFDIFIERGHCADASGDAAQYQPIAAVPTRRRGEHFLCIEDNEKPIIFLEQIQLATLRSAYRASVPLSRIAEHHADLPKRLPSRGAPTDPRAADRFAPEPTRLPQH